MVTKRSLILITAAQDARLATGLHPQLTSQYWNVPPWSRPSNLSTTQPADDVYIGTPYVQHHQNPPKPLGWPKRPVSGVDTSVTRANFPVAGPSLDPYPTIVQSYSARHGCYVERPLIDFPRTESGLYMVGDEDSHNAIYATPGARTGTRVDVIAARHDLLTSLQSRRLSHLHRQQVLLLSKPRISWT